MLESLEKKRELRKEDCPPNLDRKVWMQLKPKERDFYVLERVQRATREEICRLLYINSARSLARWKKRFYEKLSGLLVTLKKS